MKEVCFTFRGRTYRGFLATSTEQYPHYYWCFIDDPQLVDEIGDCISFQQDKRGPLRLSEIYPREYRELADAVRTIIVQNFAVTAPA